MSIIREFRIRLRSEVRLALSRVKLRLGCRVTRQLEIGSGPVKKSGWTTVDMCSGTDVYWDLRRALPFRNASFDRVYCSHVLEHFVYRDLRQLLRELNRVMAPGGEFLICVPNAALYVDAYLGKSDGSSLLRYDPAVVSTKRMDILNYIFYMDNHHRFMFDNENLVHHCREAGFVNCAERFFDPSIDSIERDYESLYLVCFKPLTS